MHVDITNMAGASLGVWCSNPVNGLTAKPCPSRPAAKYSRHLRCDAQPLWLVQSVAHPEKTLGTLLGYGALTSVLCIGAFFAARTLLWDYQTRKSDDAERPYDFQTDINLEQYSAKQGDWRLLLRMEPEFLVDPDESWRCRSFVGDTFLQLLVSDARRFTALMLGTITTLVLQRREDLHPCLAFQLLMRGNHIALHPKKADWKQPLGPLLLPPDAMEGIALAILEAMMKKEVQWAIKFLSPFIKDIDRSMKAEAGQTPK